MEWSVVNVDLLNYTLILRFGNDDTEVMESSYTQQQFEEKRRYIDVFIYNINFIDSLQCSHWKGRG